LAQLNIRLDDVTRDQFDALARARGLSTSDLMRELIGQALGRDDLDRPRGDITPPSLSAVDRRRLSMQHETLAILTAGDEKGGWESEYHRQMVDVLNSGYTSEYYRTFQMIQAEMTDRESFLVHDILDMFTQLQWSLQHLGHEERARLGEDADWALTFGGFDFNDSQEGRLASYAHFLINDDKWTSLTKYFDSGHERGNSHMPRLASYQRMLSVFKPMWQKKLDGTGGPNNYHFNADELREVVAAWPYPKG
jgi:uncharacterized protein YfbU (UPF0304 family)